MCSPWSSPDPGSPSSTTTSRTYLPASTTRVPRTCTRRVGDVAPGMRVRFGLMRDGGRLVVTRLAAAWVRLRGAVPHRPIEDETPHHGGVVAMAGELHVEAAASRDGTGACLAQRRGAAAGRARRCLRRGAGRLSRTASARRCRSSSSEGTLLAGGPPFPGDEVRVHLELRRAGGRWSSTSCSRSRRRGGSGRGARGALRAGRGGGGRPRSALQHRVSRIPSWRVAATADGRLAVVSEAEGGDQRLADAGRRGGAQLRSRRRPRR